MSRVVVGFVLFWIVGLISLSDVTPTTQEVYNVAVVDTQVSASDWDGDNVPATRKILQDALSAAKATDPDYIIFPEDSRFFEQSLPAQTLEALTVFQNNDTHAVIVDSSRVEYQGQTVLQAAIFDPMQKEISQSHKRYLVPQGEFMPYLYQFLFSLFERGETSTILGGRLAYEVGPNTSQQHFADNLPGVLFCFEVVDARGIKRLVLEREGQVPFIAHVVSHGWINESSIFRQQLDTMLRVQARWSDIAIVTAGNHIPGNYITAKGTVQSVKEIAAGEKWRVSVVAVPRL